MQKSSDMEDIMALLTAKEIMEIIPHRQPFMLLDTIEEMTPGVSAVAKKCVSYNEPFSRDIFQGNRSCLECLL